MLELNTRLSFVETRCNAIYRKSSRTFREQVRHPTSKISLHGYTEIIRRSETLYINLFEPNRFCIIDKKLALPRAPSKRPGCSRHINIIRAFLGVARVNIFMRIYTRSFNVPPNKVSRSVDISRGEALFLLHQRRNESLPLEGKPPLAFEQKPAAENNANILQYSMLKQRAGLLFSLSFTRVTSGCDTPNHPWLTETVPRKSLAKKNLLLLPWKFFFGHMVSSMSGDVCIRGTGSSRWVFLPSC